MGNEASRDVARQAANAIGALFQAGATFAASATIQGVVDEGPRSLVEPALYAFTIWALIFVLSLAYAAYQALPSNRDNPLLRRVGPFTAAAFFCTGLWSVFVPLRLFGLAQLMLLGIFAFLLLAYLRLSRYEIGVGRGERWLVALPLGPFLGWVTAANAVSLTAEAVRRGLVDAGGAGEAILGSVLLLLGAALACALILVGRAGPAQGYLSYGATVLWALTAIVANQYAFSSATTGAALLAAGVVAIVLFAAPRTRRPGAAEAERRARERPEDRDRRDEFRVEGVSRGVYGSPARFLPNEEAGSVTIDVREGRGSKMRAAGFRRYGPPEVMEALELPRPEPGPGQILIKVAAAGVNPADWALRGGRLRPFVRLELPFVSGSDVAGIVTATGPGVTGFQPGEAVYAMTPTGEGGGYAEYAAVAAENVARAPSGLSLGEAAAVPLVALTALQALRDKAGLAAGQHVLIHGASGGVGTFAVQIAKAMGARVTATCSGRNVELVRGLGADEVLDYTSQDAAADGPRYDVVFGAVNTLPYLRWRRALRPGGTIVTVNPLFESAAVGRLVRVIGRARLEGVLVRPSGRDLETVGRWISAGKVRPVIDRSYPLSDAAEAHRYSESRRARGKLVLVVDEILAAETVKSSLRGQLPGGTAA